MAPNNRNQHHDSAARNQQGLDTMDTRVTRIFEINGHSFQAEDCIQGVLINPVLPHFFDCTENNSRPASHEKFWFLPYIVTETIEDNDRRYAERVDEYADKAREFWLSERRPSWLRAYPSGVRYNVRCLDGGAWDRSTNFGFTDSLSAALALASVSDTGE